MDPDTLPEEQSKIFEFDDRQFDLVFSDEFNRYVLIQYVRLRCVAVCCARRGEVFLHNYRI